MEMAFLIISAVPTLRSDQKFNGLILLYVSTFPIKQSIHVHALMLKYLSRH